MIYIMKKNIKFYMKDLNMDDLKEWSKIVIMIDMD